MLLLCGTWLAASGGAQAQNPADAQNTKLAAQVLAAGKSPRGVVPLLQLWGSWDKSTPARLTAELTRLTKDARLSPDRRVMIESMLAQARLRLGDPEAVHAPIEQLGYLTHFRVIGPFDNEGKSGFDNETPVEQKRMQAPDLLAQYPGSEHPVSWRELPDVMRSGFVSFGAVMRPLENVCGVAETFVNSDRARPLSLWIGAGGAVKVYWNGTQVFRDAAYRSPSPDRSVVMVGAHKDWNRLLVKVCNTNAAWGFQLRIGDEKGGITKGLRTALTTTAALDIAEGNDKVALPGPALLPLAWFEEQAKADKPKADVLADFARYLDLTGSDDPAERRAKQFAARAAELDPSAANLRLAAQLAEERAETMRFADRAYAAFPQDSAVQLFQATLRTGGPSPEDALPLLDRIAQSSDDWPAAMQARADILRDLELPQAALALLRKLQARVGDSPELLRLLASVESDAGHPVPALELQQRLLAVRYDDGDARRALLDDALARGDSKTVLEHLDVVRAITPGSARTLLYIAGVYDALGRDDMVLATYRDAMALAPEAEGVYVAYARALLRAQQDEAAAEALQKALALKPQDAEARELLEVVHPSPRSDEAYAVPSEQILARRLTDGGYPYTVLEDLTVKTVFDNGLGSTFRQLAVEVHDEEGARRFRTHGFTYDPDSQHIDLRLARVYRKDGGVLESVRTYEEQLGEPWYRIYYDTRSVNVIFPDLEPGDVVEVRYRIDDVAHRNLYADYFGDLHLWQDFVPVLRSQYVLVTPAAREIFTNEPQAKGLIHTRTLDGKRRIDRYLAENLPALVSEDGMPGVTEQSPYLHVSTYKTWQDVGRWYWGLIKDQLYADDALKRTVAGLVAGASSTRDKVERIHDWAVTHTRYVGLEFGIHGFLPYRVPLIVQRGFGDCKDKAALMYTMLREAGIDARVVLVRTRHNGAIEGMPASLAVFDHAITYVPELDLYLDGTAEHSGMTELPSEDQGVMVLLVGPEGAELRHTPVLAADRNLRTRTLAVQLSADGSARVDAQEEVTGGEAAGYREYYQAPGTRSERFERSLGALYPGVELQSQHFEPLDQLGKSVRYSYRIRVPQLARWDAGELQVPPSVLNDLVRSMARTPTRVQPLDLASARAYTEERTVELPVGMRAVSVPRGGEASSKWGKLTLRFDAQKTSVKIRTEFRLERDRVAPGDYPEFRSWIEAADQLLRQRVGVRRGAP
ncbi:MAG TPA: DUF3857 domain-containing protein [Polyangiales bacterium]